MFMAAGKLVGLVRGSSTPATITKTDNKSSTSNLTTYSFVSTALGTPSADRYIVVVAAASKLAGTVSSVTVAGAATTKLTNKSDGTNTEVAIFITNAVDASNSTGTISVTLSAGAKNCGITVYAVTGLLSNAADGTPQTTATSGATMSLPVSAGGVAIGGSITAVIAPNYTWSGLTEDVDQTLDTAGDAGSEGAASIASATAQTLSVICTAATTTSFGACCVALR